jgi:hypothetical protein
MNELILMSIAIASGMASFILIPKLLKRKGIRCMP